MPIQQLLILRRCNQQTNRAGQNHICCCTVPSAFLVLVLVACLAVVAVLPFNLHIPHHRVEIRAARPIISIQPSDTSIQQLSQAFQESLGEDKSTGKATINNFHAHSFISGRLRVSRRELPWISSVVQTQISADQFLDEVKSLEGLPLEEAAAYRPGRPPKRHCGGGCILKYLEAAGTEAVDQNWRFPNDTLVAEDGVPLFDGQSSCKGLCGRHGVCQEGSCLCSALFSGVRCQTPVKLPGGLSASFEGDFLFNAGRLRRLNSTKIKYHSSPKLGSNDTKTIEVEVTEKLRSALPEDDFLAGRMYNTCAVVGNSGLLLSFEMGTEIDSHDMAMRFNLAPTKGYERHVGTRSTFRLVNTNHAGWHEGQEIDIQQLQSQVGLDILLKYRQLSPGARLLAFDPAFSEYVSSNIGYLPTGGFFGIWLALHRCHHVDLYGFHAPAGSSIPHHYYNTERPAEGEAALHDYAGEAIRIKSLAGAGLLTPREPCRADGCAADGGSRPPLGSECQCGSGGPLPVARPGFCSAQQSPLQFEACTGALN